MKIWDMKSGYRILKASLLKEKSPITISLHITNKCNFNCSYCDIHSRSKYEMKTKDIYSLIEQFSELGTLKMGISGGEPLIRDDIGDIVDYAKKNGIKTSITSNGSLIRKRAKELKNLDLLLISYDGKESNKIRNSKSDTLDDIRFAIKSGIKVWTITVLTRESIKCLDILFKESRKYGFSLLFQPLNLDYSLNTKMKGKEIDIDEDDLRKAIDKIISAKKRGYSIANSYSYLRLIRNGFVNRSDKCFAGKRYINIDANGNVYPCGVLFDQMKSVNGEKEGYGKAFKKIPDVFYCPGCKFPCYLEEDLIFRLKADAIKNVIKY